jgi:hypothetical protein
MKTITVSGLLPTHPERPQLFVSWFSAGVSSAVATKLAAGWLDKIIYIHIDDQHQDTTRFISDCERWFQREIEVLQSPYRFIEAAVDSSHWVNGPGGPSCMRLLKKRVRKEWEAEHSDYRITYVWGMDVTELERAERLQTTMPDKDHIFPLIVEDMTKEDAHKALAASGIKRPAMYDLGYHNNKCLGCLRGGKGYWNRIRVDFPGVFAKRAMMERRHNGTCINGIFLDELDPAAGNHEGPICGECGILCEVMRL